MEFKLQEIPIIFEEIVVTAERLKSHPKAKLISKEISEKNPSDIGLFLREVPGASAIKKGGSCLDPVIRGAKGDQLNVMIDGGVHVCGCCPNRMDPPTSHIQAEDLEKIEIFKGPFTARFGPTMGGIINLVMNKPIQYDIIKKFRF